MRYKAGRFYRADGRRRRLACATSRCVGQLDRIYRYRPAAAHGRTTSPLGPGGRATVAYTAGGPAARAAPTRSTSPGWDGSAHGAGTASSPLVSALRPSPAAASRSITHAPLRELSRTIGHWNEIECGGRPTAAGRG